MNISVLSPKFCCFFLSFGSFGRESIEIFLKISEATSEVSGNP